MEPERIGPWRITGKLGSGGMGHVYLGEQGDTGEKAAVKVLTASLARESGFVERFNREIDAMRTLSNPHIVQLFDSGVDGENYYYAMEYVEGETLMGVLRRDKRIPWRRAIEISIEVCQALKSAHDAGIIHRDLKPSNLLVMPSGTVKLTDFGVAQVFASQRLTVTGGIIGTAEYMSPEQAQGKRANKQSDLYSLGAVLYAMVTGRTPFSGSTAVEVIQKHKFGLFDRPRLIVPDLPQKVEDTICKLLEKDPAKRFPDALVLQRHLEQLIRHEDFASGITLADASCNIVSDATTVATFEELHPQARGPKEPRIGPATLMQSLMRAQITELEQGNLLTALLNNLFVQVALLALIATGIWWVWPRSMSAEEMYNEAVALLQQEPGPEWSRAKEKYLRPLLEKDSGTWRERVEPLLGQVETYELTRPARGAKRTRAAAIDSEPQRFLQLALHYRQIGDLVRAERTLAALEGLLAGDEEHTKIREAAARMREELQKASEDTRPQSEWLEATLARASSLSAAGQVEEARRIWEGIIELYSDDARAANFVEEARAALAADSK